MAAQSFAKNARFSEITLRNERQAGEKMLLVKVAF
jgi:hypothetical protein